MTVARFSLSLLRKYKHTEPRALQIYRSICAALWAEQPQDICLLCSWWIGLVYPFSGLRFRDRKGQQTWGGEVVLSALSFQQFRNHWEVANGCWRKPSDCERKQQQQQGGSFSERGAEQQAETPPKHKTRPQNRAPLLLATQLMVLKLFWCFFWNLHSGLPPNEAHGKYKLLSEQFTSCMVFEHRLWPDLSSFMCFQGRNS